MKSATSNGIGGIVGFLLREGTAVIFALMIWYVIWGGYNPTLDTPERAFNYAMMFGLICIAYLGFQATAVVTAPLAKETRYLMDLMLSLLPLALIGYAAAQSISGQLTLTQFQRGVLVLGGLAALIDVIIYTWFNMKLNKLASDFVSMR